MSFTTIALKDLKGLAKQLAVSPHGTKHDIVGRLLFTAAGRSCLQELQAKTSTSKKTKEGTEKEKAKAKAKALANVKKECGPNEYSDRKLFSEESMKQLNVKLVGTLVSGEYVYLDLSKKRKRDCAAPRTLPFLTSLFDDEVDKGKKVPKGDLTEAADSEDVENQPVSKRLADRAVPPAITFGMAAAHTGGCETEAPTPLQTKPLVKGSTREKGDVFVTAAGNYKRWSGKSWIKLCRGCANVGLQSAANYQDEEGSNKKLCSPCARKAGTWKLQNHPCRDPTDAKRDANYEDEEEEEKREGKDEDEDEQESDKNGKTKIDDQFEIGRAAHREKMRKEAKENATKAAPPQQLLVN